MRNIKEKKNPRLNYKMMRFDYYIGIDPGVETGICVWASKEKTILCLDSDKIHKVMKLITHMRDMCIQGGFTMLVRLEDARLRKYIPWQKTEKAERGRREGAGSVKRSCQILEDFCSDEGINIELVAPKNNITKMDADRFKQWTGWKGRTNEHSRDSAGLVYGK